MGLNLPHAKLRERSRFSTVSRQCLPHVYLKARCPVANGPCRVQRYAERQATAATARCSALSANISFRLKRNPELLALFLPFDFFPFFLDAQPRYSKNSNKGARVHTWFSASWCFFHSGALDSSPLEFMVVAGIKMIRHALEQRFVKQPISISG